MFPLISCVRGINTLSATNFELFVALSVSRLANSATTLKSLSGISYDDINRGCFCRKHHS